MKPIALGSFRSVVVLLLLGGSATYGDISGFVRDAVSMAPLAGAVVSVQAVGPQTFTAVDGSYTLAAADGTGLIIVAGAKGYYYRSTISDAPAAGVDILLDPVPQDDNPDYTFMEPEACAGCHPDQFNDWSGSAMSNAGLNTWVHDIYSGKGTPGGMGGFVYLRDSVFASTNPASECASCHQPEGWMKTPFSALQDPLETPTIETLHGISCDICHKIADIDLSKVNFPGLFPGAVTVTRPATDTIHQVQYGVLGDVDYIATGLMRGSYQPQLRSAACAACHQDNNDPDQNHSYTGITSEPTYLEWLDSPYGDVASPLYADCVDCHMPPSGETEACAILFPPITRDPSTVRLHRIEGTTPTFLENAVELSMSLQQEGTSLRVDVAVANTLTGHHVPTGVTVRNMILLVEAWVDGQDPLTNPLTHTGTETIHELGGIGDPAQGYYAGLPGKFFAKVNHDANLEGPTFFTDATGIQFDNRIPALATDETSYSFELPTDGGLVRVRSRLIYRRAFRFLVDAKGWTQDGHGNPLADVAGPHYGHLMEIAEESVAIAPMEGACCQFDGSCTVLTETLCQAIANATWAGGLTDCSDSNLDGRADACAGVPTIPTVSHWGLMAMALVLLTGATLLLRRRQPAV